VTLNPYSPTRLPEPPGSLRPPLRERWFASVKRRGASARAAVAAGPRAVALRIGQPGLQLCDTGHSNAPFDESILNRYEGAER